HKPIVKKRPPPAPAPAAAIDEDGNLTQPDAVKLGEAQRALGNHNAERALKISQNLLKLWPSNPVVIGLGVRAACQLQRDRVARNIFGHLPPAFRAEGKNLREKCLENGVVLE
ncbi:MAG TPA: hypothetical protein VFP84_17675, partial [Kofleriaceae bacterium]|nr:hypothetical protein [Kofleriaceae bacterium]